jgi:hypothetical protein
LGYSERCRIGLITDYAGRQPVIRNRWNWFFYRQLVGV